MPFMYSAVSSGPLLRKVHASSSESTGVLLLAACPDELPRSCMLTLQSVDGPRFKLFECYLGRRRQHVQVQSVLVILLLELGLCELSSLVVKICAALGVNSGVVVADHDCL
jgi:hypothetical protein